MISYERVTKMYFEEAFEKIKTSLEKSKVKAGDGHYAIQVRMTDYDCGGTFYIEQKDGKFYIEPYNYFDFDTDIEVSFKDLKSLADGKLDVKKAESDGKIYINGNYEEFILYANGLKKAPVKRATKKTTEAPKEAPKKPSKTAKSTAKKVTKSTKKETK